MISELDPMTRRPLAPDLWEQALINGRIVSPGSDQEALEYAEKWYARQGGLFDEVEAAPPAPEPVENTLPDEEFEALMLEGDHATGPAEPVESPVDAMAELQEAGIKGMGRRARARKAKGQFQGDDPATPDRDEAFVED